jgi:hypothetical protein
LKHFHSIDANEISGTNTKKRFLSYFLKEQDSVSSSLVLDRVLDEEDELSELIEGRIVNIFYLFSQAENYVKEVVADRVVLKRIKSCLMLAIIC